MLIDDLPEQSDIELPDITECSESMTSVEHVESKTDAEQNTLSEVEDKAEVEAETDVEPEARTEAEPDFSVEPDRLELLAKEERTSEEYADFKLLFPDMKLSELPDSVTESVRNGVPLAAACALYERRRAVLLETAAKKNSSNRELSISLQNDKTNDGYFTLSEVREMSANEIRSNYKRIIESMTHWN